MKNILFNSLFIGIALLLGIILRSCIGQESGCTDSQASNFNPSSTQNDGSCLYNNTSISPSASFILDDSLSETSGLIFWDGFLWSINDSDDTSLYKLNTLNGKIVISYPLPGQMNVDWEEISQDDTYLYIGDFGNNATGIREDLHVLRIEKQSLQTGNPIIDTIIFSYEDQYDFSQAFPNQTDFDCEAFVVTDDSMYLFTKQWNNSQSSVYVIPKIPGTYLARKKDVYDLQGLVTGATYLESNNLLVLCGYSILLQPFICLLYDFDNQDFFGGNVRRIAISLPFHQLEGICTSDGTEYYLTNEHFNAQAIGPIPQKLHVFDLEEYLEDHLD